MFSMLSANGLKRKRAVRFQEMALTRQHRYREAMAEDPALEVLKDFQPFKD